VRDPDELLRLWAAQATVRRLPPSDGAYWSEGRRWLDERTR